VFIDIDLRGVQAVSKILFCSNLLEPPRHCGIHYPAEVVSRSLITNELPNIELARDREAEDCISGLLKDPGMRADIERSEQASKWDALSQE
jgi:hypothetical protein